MTRPNPTLAACAAGLLIALGGCAATAPPAAAPGPEGGLWSLVALHGQALPALPLARVPMIELRDGQVAGTSGCNRLSGAYTLAGTSLRFGPVVGTRMMCPDGMALERDVLAMLGAVAGWRMQGAQLALLDAGGQPLASFASNLRRYACGDAGTVLVRYEGEGAGARATLLLAGREHVMRAAPVGSGARYVVEQGRRPDMSMEWRTKGDEGMLLEAPLSDSRQPEDLKAFARCQAR